MLCLLLPILVLTPPVIAFVVTRLVVETRDRVRDQRPLWGVVTGWCLVLAVALACVYAVWRVVLR